MKTIFISIFLLFLHLSSVTSQKKYESWDYVFDGTCLANETLCLPFNNISFSYIWENITEETIISEANTWIKSNPNIHKKIHIDQSRSWFQKSFGLFVDEKVNINESIASFLENETYSSLLDLSHFKHMPYYERDLKLLERLKLSPNDSVILKHGIMLLYNFYHFDDSPNKADLRLFPKKPISPLLYFTNYEIRLLDKDEAQTAILDLKNHYFRTFFVFHDKIVNATFNETEFKGLFNRSEIKLDDWAYVLSLVYTYSTYDEKTVNGKQEPISFIAPIIRLAVQNKERDDYVNKRFHNWNVNDKEKKRKYNFEATTKLLRNDEILIDSLNKQHEVWLQMGFLIKRPDNCITINLVPKEVEETFKIPSKKIMNFFIKSNYNFKVTNVLKVMMNSY